MRLRRLIGAAFISVTALTLIVTMVVTNRQRSSPAGAIYTPYMLIMRGRINTVRIGQTVGIKGVLRTFAPNPKGISHINAEISDVSPAPSSNTAIIGIGIGVQLGAASPLSILHQIPLVRSLAPPTADYLIIGRVATYQVLLARCITSCQLGAVWQLQDGGRLG